MHYSGIREARGGTRRRRADYGKEVLVGVAAVAVLIMPSTRCHLRRVTKISRVPSTCSR